MPRTLAPAALTLLALTALPALATTSFYTSESAFQGAASGLTFAQPSYDFSGFTPGTLGMSILDVDGTGVDFSSSWGNLNIHDGSELLAPSGQDIHINLSSGILAFGFHFTVLSGGGLLCVDASASPRCTEHPYATSTTTLFFGLITDSPILCGILVRPLTCPQILIEDFLAGVLPPAGVAEAAEPLSVMLAGTGLVMVSLLRRLRHRKK